MTDKIKYCIWDIGQTIYPYTLEPFNEWAKQHTTRPERYTESHNIFKFDYKPYMTSKIDFLTFCHSICDNYDIPYRNTTQQEINKALHAGVGPVYPDTIAAMQKMKDNNIQNGILSNALPILHQTVKLNDLILDKNIFTSYNLRLLKPDPKIFNAMRSKLGCKFNQIIFIDNKSENVKAATKLGMIGVLCRHGQAPLVLEQALNPLFINYIQNGKDFS